MDQHASFSMDALRQAVVDGESSGPSTPFDFDAFFARRCGESAGHIDGVRVLRQRMDDRRL